MFSLLSWAQFLTIQTTTGCPRILQIPFFNLLHQRPLLLTPTFSLHKTSQVIHSEKYMHLHPALLTHTHVHSDMAAEVLYIRNEPELYEVQYGRRKKKKVLYILLFLAHLQGIHTLCSDYSICPLLYPCSICSYMMHDRISLLLNYWNTVL